MYNTVIQMFNVTHVIYFYIILIVLTILARFMLYFSTNTKKRIKNFII